MERSTIEVGQRGVITLPSDVRRRHGIAAGDAYQLLDFDGVLVLAPLRPLLPELAAEIEDILTEEGLTLDDLLTSLRAERRRLYAERWQPALAAVGVELPATDTAGDVATAQDGDGQ
ncbi:MAG: AbrB/MazE/SpoVT family DNA-binding domain-containing protein [Chloroflexi bacterium]|nr:AbrB/MazE/SpoVT family DNA-binding domain-containing protein [Chloroflexota bacterium]